jgi:FHA domain-containing protein
VENQALHLNSVHLQVTRREEFRRAREALLSARGSATQHIELEQLRHALAHPDTLVNLSDKLAAPAVPSTFYLMEKDKAHPLKVGINTVGRLPDNDVVIDDPHISRRHCAVLVHSSRNCEVHDTASKNGTFVNGQKIGSATRLSPGDKIQMCDSHLVLMNGDESQPEPSSDTTSV